MKTPDEIGREIAQRWGFDPDEAAHGIGPEIAAAIRSAMLVEREAIAKLVYCFAEDDLCIDISAAIRARATP